MKVLYLPLDSRPCNAVFPLQMAAWAGADCIVPPAESMDRFTRPSDWPAIRAFLEDRFAEADAVALSVDQLCFGGLLASREEDVSAEEALARMETLEQLHARYPEKPIHAFSTILRTTISTLRLSDIEISLAVTAYSELSDRWETLRREEDRIRLAEAERRVPPETLRRILEIRRRNHAVNLKCVAWRREGVLASLDLLMEDSQPYGLHRREQRTLAAQMEGLTDAFLHNGTDEGGCVCVARALSRGTTPLAVRWIGAADGGFIARYEDRPFAENLRDGMAGLRLREEAEAENVLVIAAPPDGKQGDFHGSPEEKLDEAETRKLAEGVNRLISRGKRVYLLDLLCANGGSPALLRAVNAAGLAGYSAWNTATNALGTLLAQIVTDGLAGKPNLQFRNERFMDDMIYESILRRELDRELRAAGEDPYHLADPDKAERSLNEKYRALARDPAFAGVFGAIRTIGEGSLALPWPRTFEALARNRRQA